jgi:hypothetical protein
MPLFHFKILLSSFNQTDITNSMEQNHSWDVNGHSASKEILCPLWNSKVHYHVHKSLQLVLTLSQKNPVHSLDINSMLIHNSPVCSALNSLTSHLLCTALNWTELNWALRRILWELYKCVTCQEVYSKFLGKLGLWCKLSSSQNVPEEGKASIFLLNKRHMQAVWHNPTASCSRNSEFSSINIF